MVKVIYALWPWPLTFFKIYRAHPCLMGSLHVKCHDDRCKGEAVMRRKPFSVIYALWPWPLTSKSIGHILASWGVCMWSFMMIGVKGKQLCAGNQNADDRRTDERTDRQTDGRTDRHGDSSIPPPQLRCRGFKNFGTDSKVLSSGIHMRTVIWKPYLFWFDQKLMPRLTFFKRRSKLEVKVTGSKILVQTKKIFPQGISMRNTKAL